MKMFLFVLFFALVSCTSGSDGGNGGDNGQVPNPTPVPTPVDTEPSTHEKPFKLSDEGLKMGGIKSLGVKYIIGSSSRQFSPAPPQRPVCATIPVMGSDCQAGMEICQNAEGTVEYSCGAKETYKVFGWIYEKNGLDYSKMAEGVSVDIYSFAFCVGDSRGCSPFAGPVKTDKWGYFELTTGTLLDTLRLDGMPKYYAFCNKGKPIAGGGQYITNSLNKAIGPFKQMLVKPDTCLE